MPRAAKVLVATLVALVLPRVAAAQPEAARPAPLLASTTSADDVPRGQIKFRSFGAYDGLRNLFIVSIVQDSNGLLWVATDDGVYRYDGQQFTHF